MVGTGPAGGAYFGLDEISSELNPITTLGPRVYSECVVGFSQSKGLALEANIQSVMHGLQKYVERRLAHDQAPRIKIFLHGGLVGMESSTELADSILQEVERDRRRAIAAGDDLEHVDFYPIFINWETGIPLSYLDGLLQVRNGQEISLFQGVLMSPFNVLADAGRALGRMPRTMLEQAKQLLVPHAPIANPSDGWSKSARLLNANDAAIFSVEPQDFVPGAARLISTPLIDFVGQRAFDNMQRRTRVLFLLDEDYGTKGRQECGAVSRILNEIRRLEADILGISTRDRTGNRNSRSRGNDSLTMVRAYQRAYNAMPYSMERQLRMPVLNVLKHEDENGSFRDLTKRHRQCTSPNNGAIPCPGSLSQILKEHLPNQLDLERIPTTREARDKERGYGLERNNPGPLPPCARRIQLGDCTSEYSATRNTEKRVSPSNGSTRTYDPTSLPNEFLTLLIERQERIDALQQDKRVFRIDLLAHSMGAVVANEILRTHDDLYFENVVYLGAAASIRDFAGQALPYLRANPTTTLFNITLHPELERTERNYLSIIPRGSLLAWLDGFVHRPHSKLDYTMGSWNNFVHALPVMGYLDAEARERIIITGYGLDAAHPRKHADLNDPPSLEPAPPPGKFEMILRKLRLRRAPYPGARFWRPEFWRTEADGGRDSSETATESIGTSAPQFNKVNPDGGRRL